MNNPHDLYFGDPAEAAIYAFAMRQIAKIISDAHCDVLQLRLRRMREERDGYQQPTLWEAA